MASPESVETSEIKRRGRRRLIGAVTLVLLLVVFVPMLLDSEPRPARQEPTLTIPPRDSAPPLPAPPADRVAAKPQQAEASAKPGADSSAASGKGPGAPSPKAAETAAEAPATPGKAPAAAPAEPPRPAKVVPVPAPSESALAEAKKPAEPKKAAADPKLEGFAVQVGAFRDEEKLRQARQKLGAAGVVHYTERLESKGGPLTRLRAGPFPTRAAAEAALAKVRRASLEGKVVPLP